jgi:C4-dicarboxylate-specific signal transduction histidine kinase
MAGVTVAVEQIQKSMTRLHRLLGSSDAERELMVPLEVVADIAARFNEKYSTNIEVDAQNFSEKVRVYTGREDFAVALTNILTNAYESAPKKQGLIRLGVDLVLSDSAYLNRVYCLTPLVEDRHYLEVSVSDQGPGLSTARLTQLFMPEDPDQGAGPLEGLGIPASLSSIKSLGGTLCIERDRVDGAKVSVLIPVLGLR